MAMCLPVRWKKDRILQFRLALFSGRRSRDAVERQMSHQERSSVRAAYIHKAEHLGERRLMLQWWADYLIANREKGIGPFDFAKIYNPLK